LACIEPEHYAMTLSSHTKSAHALHDWLAQRITAGVMAAFTLIVLAQVIFNKGTMGYEKWAGIFAPHWMKLLSLVVILALAYHVWLGMREIYMQVFTIVWLVGCVGWAIQVLWRI
jgi:succinate dehydrogenase / fumarate reductase membrane anchor subunit